MSGNPQAQGARPLPPGIRVNQIQTLPHLTDQQKASYTRGVASLYEAFQKHDKESPEYKTAAAKLLEFTKKMGKEMNEWKANQAAAAAAGQPSQQQPQQPQPPQERPQSQGQPAQQPQQPQQPNQQSQGPTQQPGGPRQPTIPPQILQHVQGFPYALPPNIVPGTPEAENKLKEMKNTYASMLHKQEQLASNLKKLQAMVQERQSQGQEIPPTWGAQKQQMEQQFAAVRNSVTEFRKSQESLKQQAQNQQNRQNQQNQQQPQQQQQQGPQQTPQQSQQKPVASQQPQQPPPQQAPQQPQQAPQQANGQQIKNDAPNSAVPPTPAQPQQQIQMGGQQSHPPQQQQQQQQPPQGAQAGNNQQMANNPAVQAARQQLNPGQPPMSPATSGPQQQGQPAFSGQMGQQTPMSAQRPPLNPQQASQMNQMQHSPHPQSAGGTNGPVPLTHGQAMSNAARAYSDSRGTPQIPAAQGYQPMGNRDQISNPKMPIPKTLNAPPPHPVNMGPARPTLGGPSNGAPGMMGQPVIAGHPQYHLEGDENRVLSKKKLDELVRQVTGAGEPTGEALSPEVEEVSFPYLSL